MIKTLEDKAALKKVTDLGDCADMYVSIVKNTSMTGQRVAVGMYRLRDIVSKTRLRSDLDSRRGHKCWLHVEEFTCFQSPRLS